jgi:GH24 family phage-related lysozyme (muramidase)
MLQPAYSDKSVNNTSTVITPTSTEPKDKASQTNYGNNNQANKHQLKSNKPSNTRAGPDQTVKTLSSQQQDSSQKKSNRIFTQDNSKSNLRKGSIKSKNLEATEFNDPPGSHVVVDTSDINISTSTPGCKEVFTFGPDQCNIPLGGDISFIFKCLRTEDCWNFASDGGILKLGAKVTNLGSPGVKLLTWQGVGPPGSYVLSIHLRFDCAGDPLCDEDHDEETIHFRVLKTDNEAPIPEVIVLPSNTVESGTLVTLNGAGSKDPDAPADHIVSYTWKQTGGPGVLLSSTSNSITSFTAPRFKQDTKLTFELAVSDTHAAVGVESVDVLVKAPICDKPKTVSTSSNVHISASAVSGNCPPVANDQSKSTSKNKSVKITLTATDPEGDDLTYSVVSSPSHGTLSGTAPALTYTPAQDYLGDDTFTFKANDGQYDSNIARVSLKIINGDFRITCEVKNPSPNLRIPIGQHKEVPCTLTSINGFSDPVSLDCKVLLQLNPKLTCKTDPSTITPTPDSTTPFVTRIDVPYETHVKGEYDVEVKGTSSPFSRSVTFPIRCVSCFPPKTVEHSHSEKLYNFIKAEEGFAGLHPPCERPGPVRGFACSVTPDRYGLYNDPVKPVEGVPNCTMGYGHLVHYGPCNDRDVEIYHRTYGPPRLQPGMTEQDANALLNTDINLHEKRINPNLLVQITQEEYDALVDLAFNGGPAAPIPIIRNLINNQHCDGSEIYNAFLTAHNANHQHDERRIREAILFNSGAYLSR